MTIDLKASCPCNEVNQDSRTRTLVPGCRRTMLSVSQVVLTIKLAAAHNNFNLPPWVRPWLAAEERPGSEVRSMKHEPIWGNIFLPSCPSSFNMYYFYTTLNQREEYIKIFMKSLKTFKYCFLTVFTTGDCWLKSIFSFIFYIQTLPGLNFYKTAKCSDKIPLFPKPHFKTQTVFIR